MRTRTLIPYAITVPLLVAAHAAPARAEVRIEGTASNVHVDARDASTAAILAALAQRFNLRVSGTVRDRRISADYDGSLRHVIARLLDGYNYVIRTGSDGLEVTVVDASGTHPVAPPIYRVPPYPTAHLRRDE